LSQDRLSIVTFASAGFLIASILIFGLVALPEFLPAAYPQLRHGTVGIRVISTSGQLVPASVSSMEVTVGSIQLHRVGVGEGAWITLLEEPVHLNPIQIVEQPMNLKEVKVQIGDYNLMKISLVDETATIRGLNVTLKGPNQDLKVPMALAVSEGKRSNLIIDLSFNEPAVAISQSFDPYITVTVEQPGHAPLSTIASLKPLASLGPETLGAGESRSLTFTVEPGAVVQNYLVHAEGGSGLENTFELEIAETGEFWYALTGNLWFLGGNLTSGTYNMNVHASPDATADVKFAVNLYSVPRVTGDLPDAAFSGFVPAESSQSIQVNDFALYLDKPGMYDFYLGAKEGDYEFLVDNNPASVASGDQMVTLELQSGLHTFQIFTGFSGSGRDTSWSVGIVPVAESSRVLSREATLATWLLAVAIIVFIVDVSLRFIRTRKLESRVYQSMSKPGTALSP
jgi:hypothetical protein